MSKQTVAGAAYLRLARQRLNWTQAEMARAVGVSGYRTVCKWENEERAIPEAVLILARIWTDRDCPAKFIPTVRKGK